MPIQTSDERFPPGHLPLVEPLPDDLDAVGAFLRLVDQPHCLFLDSALPHPVLGRYSYVAADPFQWLRIDRADSTHSHSLETFLTRYSAQTLPDLPPFQGGAAGLIAYELLQWFESVPCARRDEFQSPVVAVGLFDVVLAFDHVARKGWIISQGFPAVKPGPRHRRAAERLKHFVGLLRRSAPKSAASDLPTVRPVTRDQLSRQSSIDGYNQLSSNFSADAYHQATTKVIEYIHAGDIFQANLSQRLLHPATHRPVELYLQLREENPATFAAFLDIGDFQILSASPERFLSIQDRQIEARPIKGTRPRLARPEADLFAGDELQESEKDKAENVMIVDLMRNDLSRVCEPDSVVVRQLCSVESYQFVQHLVSVVQGQLRADVLAMDVIRAAFPGGSITGAPKVRAMEIIAQLEPTVRGPYCGSLGFWGFDGSMDQNILIRTITAGRGWWQLPVGGGIVAQSVPAQEYQETWHKAEGLLRALSAVR